MKKIVPNKKLGGKREARATQSARAVHETTAAVPELALSYETTVSQLREIISKTYFANDGDGYERQHWPTFRERFPNLELFWRHFIVPMTRRIELPVSDPKRIDRRARIDDMIWDASFLNYSIFMHLIYAQEHMGMPVVSSFGDFYTHLASASDLAEEFLIKVCVIFLQCREMSSPLMQKTSRDEFLELAGEWYDTKYGKIYDHHLAKGKWSAVPLPTGESVVAEYMEKPESGQKFKRFDQSIREYRNILVHYEVRGEVLVNDISLIPRRGRIKDYLHLQAVFEARLFVISTIPFRNRQLYPWPLRRMESRACRTSLFCKLTSIGWFIDARSTYSMAIRRCCWCENLRSVSVRPTPFELKSEAGRASGLSCP